jgi:hypothetical protein
MRFFYHPFLVFMAFLHPMQQLGSLNVRLYITTPLKYFLRLYLKNISLWVNGIGL